MTIRLGDIFSYNQNVLRCFKLLSHTGPDCIVNLNNQSIQQALPNLIPVILILLIFKIQMYGGGHRFGFLHPRFVYVSCNYCAHNCITLLSYIVFVQSPVYSDHVWGSLENRTLIRRTTISCPTIERKNPYISNIYATLLR